MDMMGTILNAENLRTIIVLVGMAVLFLKLESDFGKKFVVLEKRIDKFETDVGRRFDAVDRKFDSIKELTYVLNKSGIITDKDKKHVESYVKEGVTAWN